MAATLLEQRTGKKEGLNRKVSAPQPDRFYALFVLSNSSAPASVFVLPTFAASIGSGSPRFMLGPGHVDVVPVSPDDPSQTPHVYSGWDEGPWSGAVRDGQVYGRGAVSAPC